MRSKWHGVGLISGFRPDGNGLNIPGREGMSQSPSLIEAIRLHPGMYFGSKSLTAFYHFLTGFQMGCCSYQVAEDRLGLEIPSDFHDWVAYRTHFRESTLGWCNMIVATTESEEAAFDRFFELLEEHSARVPRLVAEIIGPTSSAFRYGQSCVIPPPERVRLVKYTEDPGFFALHDSENWTDHFHPYLSWMWGLSGGELVVHDEISYNEMLRENEEKERELEERVTAAMMRQSKASNAEQNATESENPRRDDVEESPT